MTPTVADIVDKVREIAAAQPDYVYRPQPDYVYRQGATIPTCVYVEPDDDGNLRGSCLIGRALVALGIDTKRLAERDNSGDIAIGWLLSELVFAGEVVRWWVDDVEPPWHRNPKVMWLRLVQNHQDGQRTWGDAVALADEDRPL